MVYRFGTCLLDPQRHRLLRDGQPVRLRAKTFRLLCYLLEHRDRTVLKAELYEAIWPQAFISEATLESTVRAVRQAIGDSGRAQQLIQTVYGYGYRFVAAVEVLADVPSGAAGEAVLSHPGTPSPPPQDDALSAARGSVLPEFMTSDNGHRALGIRDDVDLAPQEVALALTPEQPGAPSPEWEQKPVAVLAVDLVFPTATDGETGVDEPWTAAGRWEQAIAATVQGFGGVVLQRSPSLFLTVFGIPQTLEQMPQRAVQAALALRHLSVTGTGREPCPELRMVVQWGHLLADTQADDLTEISRPIGETLAWPVRLLGQAAPGEILLSPEVAVQVEGWCELQARQVALQGRESGRVGVYALVGSKPQWSRLEMHGRRPLSRFVGREQELATLRERVRQAEAGWGQLVGMIADPGIGKSRLCYEFVRGAMAPSWFTLETRGSAYGQATPYQPIIDLLRSYFHLDDRADLPTTRDQICAKLRSFGEALTPTIPAFLALFDVPVDDPSWQALEAPQRRQHALEAVKRLLLWESQRQPLLLVIENLHWIDGETQALLDRLVDSLPTAHVLLLTTYRPEYRHDWGHKTYYTQLRLDPLPHDSAHVFLTALLGDDVTLRSLKSCVYQRTQGNPFFMEESVRALVEMQDLVGTPGAYRMAKSPLRLHVSSSVQAVLAARIDRLPPEEKHILQASAVIGKDVPFAVLHAIADVSEEGLRRGLTHLQGAEFLYETSLFPEVEYTFKHALTHEVAYGSLLHKRRRALHVKIVEALEALYPDRRGEYAERLVQHALQGEVWEKALFYGHQAGEKAGNRGAFRGAVTSFEQALDALDHLPEHPDAEVLGIELRRRLGGTLSLVGEHQRSLTLLGEAAARARQLDDRARLGQVLARMVSVRRIVGDFDGALAAGREALELATMLGDLALHVHLSYRLGQIYASSGDYSRAAEVLRGNVAVLVRSTPGHMHNWCIASQAWLAEVLGLRGDFVEGRRYGEEALRLVMGDGLWYGDAPRAVRARLGVLYFTQGDLQAAILVFEEGMALCRASDDKAVLGRMLGGLGEAYAYTGRVAEGLALLDEARRHDLRTGAVGGGYVTHLRQLSAVYLLAGRVDAARQHACQALELARRLQARGDEAHALFQLGAVHARASPANVQHAVGYYRQALDLAQELGMRPLMAHCHHGLGTLYAKSDRRKQAHTELTVAIDLYRSMDMTFWLPQAEAMLAQLGR